MTKLEWVTLDTIGDPERICDLHRSSLSGRMGTWKATLNPHAAGNLRTNRSSSGAATGKLKRFYQGMNAKTALVTGAAKRIGAAIASSLHAAGMNVVIHYHKSGVAAEQLCASLNEVRPGTAVAIRADLRDESTYRPVVDFTCNRFGGLDVLINNASTFFSTLVAETTPAQWDELMATNLKAPFFLSQAAADALRRARGCIINVTDIHAVRPLKNYSVYSTAKAALIMLTQALAKDLAPEIRANAVAPGAILWPDDMNGDLKQRIVSHTMLRRPGSPEDIAGAVRYLIFDAGYVTGQVLTIDGGRTLYS